MVSPISTAVSGLMAAQMRLGVSANNTANIHSTAKTAEDGALVNDPYQPQMVQQTAQAPAGTRANIGDITPASFPVYDPSDPLANPDGIVNYPNVDPERELIEQKLSGNAFKANLKTVKTANEMLESLLKADEG